mgnify:CR=1 FL=1
MSAIRIAARMRRIKPSPSSAGTDRLAQLRREGRDIVSLLIGEPDFDTPEPIRRAAIEAMPAGCIAVVDANGVTDAGIFGIAVKTGNFAALIQFLETQGNVQVLSSPRISTMNNQKAVIKVGTDEFFVTDVSTTTVTGTSTTSTPNIELTPFFSGIALDVTPQISNRD